MRGMLVIRHGKSNICEIPRFYKRVTRQLTGCGVRREFLEPPEVTALSPQPRGRRLGNVVKIDLPSVIDRIEMPLNRWHQIGEVRRGIVDVPARRCAMHEEPAGPSLVRRRRMPLVTNRIGFRKPAYHRHLVRRKVVHDLFWIVGRILGLPNVVVDESIHGWRVIGRGAIKSKELHVYVGKQFARIGRRNGHGAPELSSCRSIRQWGPPSRRYGVAFRADKAVEIRAVDIEPAE